MGPIALGPFDLIEPVGIGGIGEVWRGVHRAQGVGVAVKVLTAANARKKQFRSLFGDEVRAVAGLDHPGVVLVLDVGEVDAAAADASEGRLVAGSPYLAMELASGGSLDQHPRPTDWRGVRDLLLAVLDALAHAHARGVVHRDLKPGNMLVCTPDDLRPGVKLSDFGLAWAMDADPSDGRSVCGTPRYMAPEQFRADWRSFGPWTDLYALGCFAWELVCGAPPWPDTDTAVLSRRHQLEDLPAFEPVVPVPDGFFGWLSTLLEKAPAARAQRAADAAWALRALGSAGEAAGEPLPGGTVAPTLVAAWSDEEPTLLELGSLDAEDLPTESDEPPRPALVTWAPPPLPTSWRTGSLPGPPMRLLGAGLGLYGLRDIRIVGREAERDRLWGALREAADEKHPRAVLLQGPSGVGTSRLAEWLCRRADELGAAEVLRAVHSPLGGPRDGVPGALIRHLRVGGLAGAGLASAVGARLRALGGGDEDDVQAITASITPLAEDAPTGAGSAITRWGAARRYLRLLARRRPVVLWLDDVQWGADALGFAKWLLQPDPEPLRVLVVATAREDGLAERPAEAKLAGALVAAGASRVALAPLEPADAATLARELIGLDGALARDVGARCAGNPMFAVQLVRDWVQRGVLVAGPRGFALAEGEARALPDDIHGLWAARVATATGATKRPDAAAHALEIAAVLGADVDTLTWELACGVAGVVAPEGLLDALLQRRLAVTHEAGWSFAHGLLRESLVRAAREAGREGGWHEACAQVIEAAAGKDGAAMGRLGRHWLAAGRPDLAIEPLGASAMRAERGGYLSEAVSLLELRQGAMIAAGVPDGDPRWGEGFWMQAVALVAQGRAAEAKGWAERLARSAERHGWARHRARAARVQGTIAVVAGDLVAADTYTTQAVALARESGEIEVQAAALNTSADMARYRGDWDRAEACYLRVLALLGDQRTQGTIVADSRQGLALVYRTRGRYEEAKRLLEEVVAWAEAAGVRNIRGNALNGLGEVARSEGRLADAEGFYRASTAVLRTLGPERSVVPRMNLALVLLMRGGHAEARPMLEAERSRLELRGRKALASGCAAMLVTCAAAERDGVVFDRELAAVKAYREVSGFVDSDIAWAIEAASELWPPGERRERARAEAAAMYGALGDPVGLQRTAGA